MKTHPKNGDVVLHCGHLTSFETWFASHWFQLPRVFKFGRPDGSRGETEWIGLCVACFHKHQTDPKQSLANFVQGEDVWRLDQR